MAGLVGLSAVTVLLAPAASAAVRHGLRVDPLTPSLTMAWRGVGSDNTIWWSQFNGTSWGPQQDLPDRHTDAAPALLRFNPNGADAGLSNDDLLMAWRGAGADNHIWWSLYDGTRWSSPQQLADRATAAGPALGIGGSGIVMAWRGANSASGDNHIWWSTFTGTGWTGQQVLADRRSDLTPGLGDDGNGHLTMVWRGVDTDNRIWWSEETSTGWTAQQVLADRRTEATPGISFDAYGGAMMAWRGAGADNTIWWSTLLNSVNDTNAGATTWFPQQQLGDRDTGTAPAIAISFDYDF
ncbi:MAG TPA: hypothetical protein VH333_24005, partial [Pseudonocardiaceae bacterium]|nr:hypothetical protein [Pseudonocardiaceae bacterium]